MKMRVMYASKKGKMESYANAIGEKFGCLVNDIPPAYPADKERLVILLMSLGGSEPSDEIKRFCRELYSNRAQNVALIVDGAAGTRGERVIKETLREAGTNLIDDTFYVKCGIFGKKLSAEEREKALEWAQSIVSSVEGT
ncbi:MAG: hypothetical protein IJ325_11950 [Clostridia bacterium]|nr:hypothetical protein [Clostridia bacterium]